MKQWVLTNNDLHRLVHALISHMREVEREGIPNCTAEEVAEYNRESNELASRLNEIIRAFRQDYLDDGPWHVERDQAIVTIAPKPGDEIYKVVAMGDKWAIIDQTNPGRPVGEHLYSAATHAHRKKRELNKAARLNRVDWSFIDEAEIEAKETRDAARAKEMHETFESF